MPRLPEIVKPNTRPLPRRETNLEPGRLTHQPDTRQQRQDGRVEPISPILMKPHGTSDQGYRHD